MKCNHCGKVQPEHNLPEKERDTRKTRCVYCGELIA